MCNLHVQFACTWLMFLLDGSQRHQGRQQPRDHGCGDWFNAAVTSATHPFPSHLRLNLPRSPYRSVFLLFLSSASLLEEMACVGAVRAFGTWACTHRTPYSWILPNIPTAPSLSLTLPLLSSTAAVTPSLLIPVDGSWASRGGGCQHPCLALEPCTISHALPKHPLTLWNHFHLCPSAHQRQYRMKIWNHDAR